MEKSPRRPSFPEKPVEYSPQVKALAVIVLDTKIRTWLERNDPKALLQAISALRDAKFIFPQPEVIEPVLKRYRCD
jgi:hypothetical protein